MTHLLPAIARHARTQWRRLLALLAVPCLAGAAVAATVDIDLPETARVAARTIYLRDVVELGVLPNGMDSATLGEVKLGMFGARNVALRISAKRIAHMIALQRPALAGLVHLSGASAVLVSLRPDGGADHIAEIRQLIREALGSQATTIEIQDIHFPSELDADFAGAHRLHLRQEEARNWSTHMEFVVDGVTDDKVVASVRVIARLAGKLGVCALRHDIAVGQRMDHADCDWIAEGLEQLPKQAITALSNLDQQGASNRLLLAGEHPTTRDFALVAGGVRRGEHVRMIVRNGGILLEQRVVALAGAQPGQTVRVQTPASGTILTVRVVGGGIVEMEL